MKNQGAMFTVELDQYQQFKIGNIENFLRENQDIIEEFTWVTPTMNSFKGTEVFSTTLDDFGAFRAFPIDLHAIMPNYLKTAEN